jgi:hypothetical protein
MTGGKATRTVRLMPCISGSFRASQRYRYSLVSMAKQYCGDRTAALLAQPIAGCTMGPAVRQEVVNGRCVERANFARAKGSLGSSGAGRRATAVKLGQTAGRRRIEAARLRGRTGAASDPPFKGHPTRGGNRSSLKPKKSATLGGAQRGKGGPKKPCASFTARPPSRTSPSSLALHRMERNRDRSGG